ncbi:Aminoglycoside phosphotransferase, partial [Penicillium coprophilum]|uniref:Aminoglycoside phosphotransferase n=1 Tax=Penicillium coprophilum TaxID=36646 RepID=UPI002385ADE0
LNSGFLNGSYNIGQKILFEDGTIWLLRFPCVKSICPKYADKKVVIEVEALSLIRERISVPVLDIKAWGLTNSNPLGLGPFILIDFIDGVCLNDVFTRGNSRLLKKEIPDSDLEIVYRQIANFILQIFEINFDRIGSLPTPRTGDRTTGFSTTLAYFQYIIDQDWQ